MTVFILALLLCQAHAGSGTLSELQGNSGRLVQLVNYRWTLPVLAELAATNGSKVVTLRNRLGVSRQSLLRTLATLETLGLIRRNPGYGHPMRPEYILTEPGKPIGLASYGLVRAARSLRIEDLALQKWSLPVVHSLDSGATRFRAIQSSLPAITSRALSLTLKDLHRASVVRRSVTDAYPPTSSYQLTDSGATLATAVNDLAASTRRLPPDAGLSTT